MKHALATVLTAAALLAYQTPAPICRVGTWVGTPAELAAIEAVYQHEAAVAANRAYPSGAPQPSPWAALVRCTAG